MNKWLQAPSPYLNRVERTVTVAKTKALLYDEKLQMQMGELSINITATMGALYDDILRAIWCCFARLQIATVGT